MISKLQKKLARQNAKTEELMTGYKLGQKSSTTRRSHSRGNLWNHQNDTTSVYQMKKEISKELNKLYK